MFHTQGPHSHILMMCVCVWGGGGEGVRLIVLGLKFWPKVIFWVYERRRDFLCRKKQREFLECAKNVAIFWGIKYEPLSDPPPPLPRH